MKKKSLLLLSLGVLVYCGPVNAAELAIALTIPKIKTVEYHRPYVAVWVEDSKRKQIAQITLWLEQEKWHRDLRSWWRRGGNRLALPVDGVSGATRKPGDYQLNHTLPLTAGDYTINIEAVREVGGREHMRIPFTWSGEPQSLSATGNSELGPISISIFEEK